jgi:hypothetical protein
MSSASAKCPICDEPVVQSGRGRPRKFCSTECKVKSAKAKYVKRVQESAPLCKVSGCGRPARAFGGTPYCVMHYARDRRGTELDGPVRKLRSEDRRPCKVDGCERPSNCRGFCGLHYNRWKSTGDPGPAGLKKRSVGRIWTDEKTGYQYQGNRLYHRVVMERIIGRTLERNETVHHKNGIRHDNRPSNLELWVKTQLAGQRVTDLIAFVVEHYPNAVRAALEGEPQALWLPAPEPE